MQEWLYETCGFDTPENYDEALELFNETMHYLVPLLLLPLEGQLNDLWNEIEPALNTTGDMLYQFADKVQNLLEDFSKSVDRAQKIFDLIMYAFKGVGEDKEQMEYDTYNLFDVSGTGWISVDDLKEVSVMYDFPALAGSKAEELHEEYDVNMDGKMKKDEFSLFVEDDTVPCIMSEVLRQYASKLQTIAGNLAAARDREEVAKETVAYLTLVSAKNMTKVGWIADALTNSSLPQAFTADVMIELALDIDNPDKVTTADVGQIVVGDMCRLNVSYVESCVDLIADPEFFTSEGYNLDDQDLVVERVTTWIENSGYAALIGFTFNRPQSMLLALREKALSPKELPALARQTVKQRARRYRVFRARKKHAKEAALYSTKGALAMRSTLLGGVSAMSLLQSPSQDAAVCKGQPAAPETLEFAQWLSWNASDTAVRFEEQSFDYSATSSSQSQSLGDKVMGMLEKISGALDTLKEYSSPSGQEKFKDQIFGFSDKAADLIVEAFDATMQKLLEEYEWEELWDEYGYKGPEDDDDDDSSIIEMTTRAPQESESTHTVTSTTSHAREYDEVADGTTTTNEIVDSSNNSASSNDSATATNGTANSTSSRNGTANSDNMSSNATSVRNMTAGRNSTDTTNASNVSNATARNSSNATASNSSNATALWAARDDTLSKHEPRASEEISDETDLMQVNARGELILARRTPIIGHKHKRGQPRVASRNLARKVPCGLGDEPCSEKATLMQVNAHGNIAPGALPLAFLQTDMASVQEPTTTDTGRGHRQARTTAVPSTTAMTVPVTDEELLSQSSSTTSPQQRKGRVAETSTPPLLQSSTAFMGQTSTSPMAHSSTSAVGSEGDRHSRRSMTPSTSMSISSTMITTSMTTVTTSLAPTDAGSTTTSQRSKARGERGNRDDGNRRATTTSMPASEGSDDALLWEELSAYLSAFKSLLPDAIEALKTGRKKTSDLGSNLAKNFNTFRDKGSPLFEDMSDLYAILWIAYYALFVLLTSLFLLYGLWGSGWCGGCCPHVQPDAEDYQRPYTFLERCQCCCAVCASCFSRCAGTTACFWSIAIFFQIIVLLLFIVSILLTLIGGIKSFLAAGCGQVYLLTDETVCTNYMETVQFFLPSFLTDMGVDVTDICEESQLTTCQLIVDELRKTFVCITVGSVAAAVLSFQLIVEAAINHERHYWVSLFEELGKES